MWLPAAWGAAAAAGAGLSGTVTDPQGKPVGGAAIELRSTSGEAMAEAVTESDGGFAFSSLEAAVYSISAAASEFRAVSTTVTLREGESAAVQLQFGELARRSDTVAVSAGAGDPTVRVNIREELLDANPGRPGAPVSIPGLPVETASGGIKAPQYFAPGVAGDHGEPIAQYLRVGSYLAPNNLSANAHGNGYADPNVMAPAAIESVAVDGGSFDAAEGNHSVDLAAVYGFRERLEPFVTLTGDPRDVAAAAGWSPADPSVRAWIAIDASYGNGFLDTLEHRRQFRFNAHRVLELGRHTLTLFGLGYYGQSRIPGLAPIDVPNLHDTIDPRQREQTHTGEAVANDVWRIDAEQSLALSGFFRTYNLALYSNFGAGLIRQSEFRTEAGGNLSYSRTIRRWISVRAGFDWLREAPRRLDLDRYASMNPAVDGPFQRVTANDVTLNFLAPYVSVEGWLTGWLHYDAGWRRDQIQIGNVDLLHASNSYERWAGVNSPKATLRVVPREGSLLPAVSLSAGQSFFSNDPRIGMGSVAGTPVSRAHALQLVVNKPVGGIDWRVTMGRVTQEQSLAKIDPDTGLQYDEGPSRNRYITASARRYFRGGLIEVSVSKADARDLSGGAPSPEAPRRIVDVLGTLERLPFGLRARFEYEEVGRKPLGDGFVSAPVREFRGALVRDFGPRIEAGVHFLAASGYTGQTTEVLALPGDSAASERITGVYLPSYATLSLRYRLGRLR